MPWKVVIGPGSPGCRAELPSDAADPDPQVLQVVSILRAPDLGQELAVEDDLAGVGRQVLEQQPLRPAQLDQLAVAAHHPALEVDLDVTDPDDARHRV